MHVDELHTVRITQTHRAIVESEDVYELDSDDYQKFIQLDDSLEREEFILDRGVYVGGDVETVDITETLDVIVSDDHDR